MQLQTHKFNGIENKLLRLYTMVGENKGIILRIFQPTKFYVVLIAYFQRIQDHKRKSTRPFLLNFFNPTKRSARR